MLFHFGIANRKKKKNNCKSISEASVINDNKLTDGLFLYVINLYMQTKP